MSDKKKIQLMFLNDNLALRETRKRLMDSNFVKEDFLFCYDTCNNQCEQVYEEWKECSCEICNCIMKKSKEFIFFSL